MSDRKIFLECIACGSEDVLHAVTCTDNTVSKESFQIWGCKRCSFRYTQKVPDELNIGRYYQSDDYVSHSDTKKGLINRLYHLARTITLSSKRKLVEKVTGIKHGSLLDYGAGTGAFANAMKKAGWKVTGLEPDEAARQMAKLNYDISLQPSTDLQQLPTNNFDTITLWHVLEHVHQLHNTLELLERSLKPSGKLVIAVPNYTSFDAQYYKAFWAAYDVPRHLYHFSPYSMELLLNKMGFVLDNTYPMWFDSFYVSMLSEKYKNEKNNYLHAFWIGLQSNWKALSDPKKCSSVIYVFRKK